MRKVNNPYVAADVAGSIFTPSAALTALYETTSRKRLKTAITVSMVGVSAWQTGKKIYDKYMERFVWTVSVPNTDEIYDDLQELLLAQIPEAERRSLLARGVRDRKRSQFSDDGLELVSPFIETRDENKTRLAVYYDGDTTQDLVLEGHTVEVRVDRDDTIPDGKNRNKKDLYFRPEKLVFTAHSIQGRDAVLRYLQKVAESQDPIEGARLYISTRWGSWDRRPDIEQRDLSTVVLPGQQKQDVLADIRRFLGQRETYLRFGIPYHRGYLFEGPPGTGKTSLAKALAHELGLDIYYAPLNDLDQDTSLLSLISSVQPGSVLLLEDIDVLTASQSRDDDDDEPTLPSFGISLSGLLNALDGVATPSGLITIMTTNHVEVLDQALIREGRIDRKEHIGYLDDEQLGELMRLFFGKKLRLPKIGKRQITPAAVLEAIKRSIDDPEQAQANVRKLLGRSTAS